MKPYRYDGDLNKLTRLTLEQAKQLKHGDRIVRVTLDNSWYTAGYVYEVERVDVETNDTVNVHIVETDDNAPFNTFRWWCFALLPVCRKEDIL